MGALLPLPYAEGMFYCRPKIHYELRFHWVCELAARRAHASRGVSGGWVASFNRLMLSVFATREQKKEGEMVGWCREWSAESFPERRRGEYVGRRHIARSRCRSVFSQRYEDAPRHTSGTLSLLR